MRWGFIFFSGIQTPVYRMTVGAEQGGTLGYTYPVLGVGVSGAGSEHDLVLGIGI